jgi:hypothetical protein
MELTYFTRSWHLKYCADTEKFSHFWSFMDSGITDSDLPLCRASQNDVSRRSPSLSYSQIWTRFGRPVEPLRNWEGRDIEKLCRDQWMFQAPVFKFRRGINHYELDDSCVLPFVEGQERTNLKHGGHNVVFLSSHIHWNSYFAYT